MEQGRLIRTAFLAALFAALFSTEGSRRERVVFRSLLDLLPTESSHDVSLNDLARMVDFRGCDGGGTRIHDFWTFEVRGLYDLTTSQGGIERLAEAEVDFRA